MKAILKFNLPEENWEHYAAIKGQEAFFVLHDLWGKLDQMQKHEGKESIDIEELKKLMAQLAEHWNINFWDIP